MPEISVIVCTRNRASILEGCLASLAELAEKPAEVIVVDNGSTDGTVAVVDAHRGGIARLRYEYEARQGLSHARNAGLAAASGEIVAFLDDDVVVDSAWSGALGTAYDRWPDAIGVAGRVRLWWPGPRPAWIVPRLETWLSSYDKGDRPRLLDPDEVPFGANMSVRRDVAVEVGGFASDLGFSGRALLGNEEVDFFRRARGAGGVIGYEPAAVVDHRVDENRLRRRWFVRRIYAQGRADARLAARDGVGRGDLAREAASALVRGLARGWRADLRRVRSAEEERGGQVVASAGARAKRLGYGRECLALALRAPARDPRRPGEES